MCAFLLMLGLWHKQVLLGDGKPDPGAFVVYKAVHGAVKLRRRCPRRARKPPLRRGPCTSLLFSCGCCVRTVGMSAVSAAPCRFGAARIPASVSVPQAAALRRRLCPQQEECTHFAQGRQQGAWAGAARP